MNGRVRPRQAGLSPPGAPSRRSLSLWLFQGLLWLLVPLFLLRLWWRGRRQPAYRAHWQERLGWYAPPHTATPGGTGAGVTADASAPASPPGGAVLAPPLIWIHAVSVGETRACLPLVAALRTARPGCRILLTHMTPTGRETGRSLFGDTVEQCYLPYDTPGAVARFLARYRPQLGLLMETELWPGLVHACRVRALPLWLVNARLSARSAAGYRRLAWLTREALGGLAGVVAQGTSDARRLRVLGAPSVSVSGNLKFDAPVPAQEAQPAQALRAVLGATRPVWLAASTREGEEVLLLQAWRQLLPRLPDAPLLVVVPRHPQRFDEVCAHIEAAGLAFCRRRDWPALTAAGWSGPPPATLPDTVSVVLGDSMGELGLWYRAVDLAWIGGSLLPLGGQNLLEACARDCPVLVGPHTFNFAQVTAEGIAAGAVEQVANAGAIVARAAALLDDPAERGRRAAAGRAFLARHQGATRRTLQALGLAVPAEAAAVRS